MANYLIHHGIKGQQWGVQNGPPYPLDAKVKAEAYRKNEKTKVEQKYSVTKSESKRIRRLEDKKKNEGLNERQAKRLDQTLQRVEFGKKMADKELKALDKMSVEELLTEKHNATVLTGIDWATSVAFTAASVTFLPEIILITPQYNRAGDTVNASKYKTDNRVSSEDQSKLMEKYGQQRKYF